MSTPLIIIRGNSASGKTTLAHALQQQLGPNAFLISQDVVRRERLQVRDTANNPAIGLMAQLALDQRDHPRRDSGQFPLPRHATAASAPV